ncbi:MAG: hypothetical protein WDO15_05965 [Bacteroidota bacterium]
MKAYYGSKMHFFRSLFNRRLTNEGFYVSFNDTLASDTTLYVKSEPHNYNEIEIRTITDYNFIVTKPFNRKTGTDTEIQPDAEMFFMATKENHPSIDRIAEWRRSQPCNGHNLH